MCILQTACFDLFQVGSLTKQGLNEIDAVIMTANDLGLKMPVCA